MDEIVANHDQVTAFQSLFSWNLLLMLTLFLKLLPGSIVSILVFVELALDVRFVQGALRNVHQVSILVFVELALDV